MTPLRHALSLLLLGSPAWCWGYAYTAMTPDGSFKQNQTSGQAIVWHNPEQIFAFNFGGSFDTSARAAMEEWNRVNTALHYQAATGAQTCASDGYNSAGWGDLTCDNLPFGDALAITKRAYVKIGNSWYLREADIVLDRSRTWQIYSGALRPGVQDLHRVILHELGHALGLDHPDDAGQSVVAIMNSHTSNIDTLQADDRDGVLSLYAGGTGVSNSASQADSPPAKGGGGGEATLIWLALLGGAMRRARRKPPRQSEENAGDQWW